VSTVTRPRSTADALAVRIRDRTATAAVVGLGYVGGRRSACAPTSVRWVDNEEAKVETLRGRRSHPPTSRFEVAAMDRPRSARPRRSPADVIVLCLPTPLTDGAPDLTMVLTAAEDVERLLTPGVLVVLESTTYPGTTEELLRPILEGSGLRAGRDFALGYSPERIDPGNRDHRLDTTPKIVSGLTDRCRELAVSFYSAFIHTVVTTSTPARPDGSDRTPTGR
jgi:nucleotide sugar dehydrogenase